MVIQNSFFGRGLQISNFRVGMSWSVGKELVEPMNENACQI